MEHRSLMLRAQEANSGYDLRASLTEQAVVSNELTSAPRSGAPMVVGFHGIVYPTWKMNGNWFITGALQLTTRPFYYEDLSSTGYGAKGNVLQASVNYSRVSNKGSLLVRVGELSTVFGSFVIRYDDADNALIDLPSGYGYYYSPESILPVAGAQMDVTTGRWDARVQFANSSPANPRSLFAKDQYGNWAGGAGFTIRQGFRVGVSGYRGPYLDRKYRYFFPGEVDPRKLPAHALGLDASWERRHSSVTGELQKFVMPYTVIPNFRESAGYLEGKQVISPRWYAAARYGFVTTNETSRAQTVETAVSFRPNRFQIIKTGFQLEHYTGDKVPGDKTFALQLVTSLHKSIAR
ncbi:MAG TPA: hypothetical protein VGI45_26650 [Terracidiphilus sp.]|jgi:hypothetical protein